MTLLEAASGIWLRMMTRNISRWTVMSTFSISPPGSGFRFGRNLDTLSKRCFAMRRAYWYPRPSLFSYKYLVLPERFLEEQKAQRNEPVTSFPVHWNLSAHLLFLDQLCQLVLEPGCSPHHGADIVRVVDLISAGRFCQCHLYTWERMEEKSTCSQKTWKIFRQVSSKICVTLSISRL